MMKCRLPGAAVLLSFFLISFTEPAQAQSDKPEFWFEDNNLRRAGGYPPDFEEMFTQPEQWKALRDLIDVYYIRGNTLRNLYEDFGESFIRDKFLRTLKNAKIPLAIDNFTSWETNLPMLRSFGADVRYISLQSSLSKRLNPRTPDFIGEVQSRAFEAASEAANVHRAYPELQIGVIDALPTKGLAYKEPYRMLLAAFRSKGVPLSHIHLDCPYDFPAAGTPITWKGVKEVEEFVQKELGLHFGFICTSNRGGMESDKAFYDNVMQIPGAYPRENGLPDAFILMSWYPHPLRSLPEDAPDGQYPMTKTALDLARKLRAR